MGNNFRTTQAGDKFPADGQANYLHFTASGGHAGMGKNDNNGDGVDHCNIAGWKVPEDHIYSITHSLLQSSSKQIYGSISDGWVSGLDGIAIHVLTDDKVVCSRHTTEGKSPHVDFNCLLGEVKKGVMIYVAICPNGTGGFDGFTVDYSIAKGVVPSISAASEHKVTVDDVVELMDHDVACFSKDYPQKNGFSYMYNPDGLITEPSKFKPLVSYNRGQYYTIAGKVSSSENGWLKIGQQGFLCRGPGVQIGPLAFRAGPLICSVGVQYIHHQISDTDTVSQGLGAKVEISYFLIRIPPSKKIKIFYKS